MRSPSTPFLAANATTPLDPEMARGTLVSINMIAHIYIIYISAIHYFELIVRADLDNLHVEATDIYELSCLVGDDACDEYLRAFDISPKFEYMRFTGGQLI